MKKVFILAVLTILPLACQKNEINPVKEDAPVFYASFDETKAGFNYNSGAKTYSHYWDLDDEVAIFPKGNKYDKYHITNASGGVLEMVSAHEGNPEYNTGIFAFNVAVYPYSAVYRDGGESLGIMKVYVNFPTDSPYFDASSPVYGYENLLMAFSEDEHLSFKSMIGWLKVSLKGDFAVKNIRITGNNNETVAYSGMQYNYNDSYHRLGYLGAGSTYKYRNLRFQAPYPVLSTSSYTDFYIALPSVTLSKGYTLVITKEDNTTVTLVNNANTKIQENKVTPTAPLPISDYLEVAPAAKFSEAANCYVVSAAGSYRFRPVKGNSSTSVGDVASVAVLWETDNSNTAVSVGDIIESASYNAMFDYVVFSTPDVFKEGNALIAAKDSGGNILWSWHIWCTDTPEDITLSYGGQTTTFMDRNLGALSATKGDGLITHGLYYFWGRKDPFYINTSNSTNIFARVQGTISLPTATYQDASKGTVDYIAAHPTEIISAGNNLISPWFAEVPATAWWLNSKTVYDPCPPGYVTYNNNTSSTNIFKLLYDAGKYSFGGEGNFHYVIYTDDTNSIWLPAAGKASTSSIQVYVSSGTVYQGSYWLGPKASYDGKSYLLNFGINPGDPTKSYAGSYLMSSTVDAYNMYSVRCQKQ